MFTSTSIRKQPHESSDIYNLRPLPNMKATNRRNPDENFVLNGCRSAIKAKPSTYRTNSEMTLSRSGSFAHLEGSVSKMDIPTDENKLSSDTLSEQSDDIAIHDEFEDDPEPELSRLKEDIIYVDDPLDTSWYLNPVHRSQSENLDLGLLARTSPLQAAVMKSKLNGSLSPTPQEVIDKTPIESFDLSLFRNAEDQMLSCRTLTALASPYQYKLAKLKMDRLKLEENRLLHKKALSELERIRGPSPRWYELKTSGFHVEAKKNNQLLASKGHYKEIMDYRHQLLQTLEKSKKDNNLEHKTI